MVISALIAAFNEEAHIAAVVRGTAPYVSTVVVVDDGSTDQTAPIAAAAGATVLRHDANRGKGCSIRMGLDFVLKGNCTHVLFLDGDMQHHPTDIPRLIERAQEGVGDFVVGEREFRKNAMPAARFYSNVIGSAILSKFIHATVVDSQSGFRLIRADLLRRLCLTGSKYEIETEMLIKLVRAGATLERVSVSRVQYQGARSKMRPFRDTFRTCMLALQYRYWAR
jgi:glycosyltransferase involved in cell wall biosynthesis